VAPTQHTPTKRNELSTRVFLDANLRGQGDLAWRGNGNGPLPHNRKSTPNLSMDPKRSRLTRGDGMTNILRGKPLFSSADKRRKVFWGSALAVAGFAALHTIWGFKHLLFGGPDFDFSGGDLKYRQLEVQTWFAGEPVYGAIRTAVYPPASYLMLWPVMGWLSTPVMLWLWAGIYAAMLVWLARQVLHAIPPKTTLEKLWLMLLPASMYATGRSIEIGQTVLILIPLLIAGLTLVAKRRVTWREDLIGCAFILLALFKPTTAVPLVLIAYLVPGRLRPAVLITAGYAFATVIAAWFQHASPITLMRAWLHQDERVNLRQTNANLQRVLGNFGLSEWFVPAALLVLAATALWVWRYRRSDVWLLLGVTGMIARLWTYHRPFDDLLVLLPLIALLRLARDRVTTPQFRLWAGCLAAITWLSTLLSRLMLHPYPEWRRMLDVGQGLIWFAVLVFLLSAPIYSLFLRTAPDASSVRHTSDPR
jgi:hypothetical protein